MSGVQIKKRWLHSGGHKVLLLLGGVIAAFLTGCTCLLTPHIDMPAVTNGDTGEAIIVYEVLRNDNIRELYAQKVGKYGNSEWVDRGIFLAQGWTEKRSSLNPPLISDGRGGAIASWQAFQAKPEQGASDSAKVFDQMATVLRWTLMGILRGGRS